MLLQDEEGISHVINNSCISCVLCSPEMLPKFTAIKKDSPTLKLLVQFNSWPYDPSEEGRVHTETLQSFLQILSSSEKDLSQSNIQEVFQLDNAITMFIQKMVKDSHLKQLLTTLFNQHITMSHSNGLFQHFISLPDTPTVPQSLITCHMNTLLVLSSVYHCYIMGCLPQPVSTRLDDIVSIIYTSGSTGLAKGLKHVHNTYIHIMLMILWVSLKPSI